MNTTAPDGYNAMLLATHSGHGALASFLLDEGADPNAAGPGFTALHTAVLTGDPDAFFKKSGEQEYAREMLGLTGHQIADKIIHALN